ncbi:MAG: hypothetical protein RL065_2065 [Bacteroidota bacterium]|jgi:hypothetical protein
MNSPKLLLLIASLSFICFSAFSQNVGIGTQTPNASAKLELSDAARGFLPPRVSLVATNNSSSPVSSPATGLMVYNTASAGSGSTAVSPGYYYYDGTNWVKMVTSSTAWLLTGNGSLSASTNFIGTTDSVDLISKTNNTERVRVTAAGKVGIGTSSPTNLVELSNGNLYLGNSNNSAAELRLAEPSSSGTNYTIWKAQAQSANVTYTLPASQGAANSVLTNDGSGNLTWGLGSVQFAEKSADESVTSSTTLQDDNDFTFSLGANQTYEVTGLIKASCGSTGLIKVQFVAPSGSTEFINVFINRTATDDVSFVTSPTSSFNIATAAVSSTTDVIMINGKVKTSSTAGTFKLQWAQKTSNSTATTFYTDSYLKVTSVK